ncbi:MAG: lytic transglycosylase domain-containing protein [Thermoanaerobaculia bacterium]|nr:lytic transglycosylase domain-containing protein [Thermoanaerobaculia bacterium]
MAELKTNRQFQERFLDGFDRNQLRQEVQKVKPRKLSGLRKRYASWALGATLALGGIGVPLTMVDPAGNEIVERDKKTGAGLVENAITNDLRIARSIARQVASGVEAAAEGVEAATEAPLEMVSEAPRQLAMISESAKEQFFKREIPFGSIIYSEARKNNIRPELVAAVVQAESRFKPAARSGAGAIGLMQLVPKTGRWMGARDLTNPAQNIAAGSKYLKYLHERFDGNETKMIAAYNAGEGNVRRFGGVPPFKETRSYVTKVKNYENEFKDRVEAHVAELSAPALINMR